MPGQLAAALILPTLACAWPSWLIGIIITLFIFVCVVMVLTVLIQKPQGGGLASAFGGGASAGQTAFGTKTGDALTVVTIAVFVAYLLLAVVLNFAARPQVAESVPTAEGTTAPADPAATDPAGTAPATAPATNSDAKQPGAAEPVAPAPAVPTGGAPSGGAAPAPSATPPATDPAAAPK